MQLHFAWVGMIWATTRTSRTLSQIFKPQVTTKELEEIKRELSELRRLLEEIRDKSGCQPLSVSGEQNSFANVLYSC